MQLLCTIYRPKHPSSRCAFFELRHQSKRSSQNLRTNYVLNMAIPPSSCSQTIASSKQPQDSTSSLVSLSSTTRNIKQKTVQRRNYKAQLKERLPCSETFSLCTNRKHTSKWLVWNSRKLGRQYTPRYALYRPAHPSNIFRRAESGSGALGPGTYPSQANDNRTTINIKR